MPLSIVKYGTYSKIEAIKGNNKTKSFLKGLGFVQGEKVSVVTELGGNLIVRVKDSRVALDRTLANRIMVSLS